MFKQQHFWERENTQVPAKCVKRDRFWLFRLDDVKNAGLTQDKKNTHQGRQALLGILHGKNFGIERI